MASYNELLALIDAYINQNGVQAITGQVLNGVLRAMVDQLGRGYSIMGAADPTTDPGTPDGPETWFASVPGTYTNFDGIQIVDGELALLSYVPSTGFSKNTIYEGFQTVQATIDGNVGTPAVGVSYANGILSFDFHNMKGVTGDPAGFGAVTASVDSNIGTPFVQVQTSGPDTAKAIAFQFHNLKGETGVTSVLATVDNTSGNPQCAVSLNGQQLVLNFTGLKGAQGDTGSSVDYPFTIVNNLTTNDATQALSAAMGVQLESEVSQLEAKVNEKTNRFTEVDETANTEAGAVSVPDGFVKECYIAKKGSLDYYLVSVDRQKSGMWIARVAIKNSTTVLSLTSAVENSLLYGDFYDGEIYNTAFLILDWSKVSTGVKTTFSYRNAKFTNVCYDVRFSPTIYGFLTRRDLNATNFGLSTVGLSLNYTLISYTSTLTSCLCMKNKLASSSSANSGVRIYAVTKGKFYTIRQVSGLVSDSEMGSNQYLAAGFTTSTPAVNVSVTPVLDATTHEQECHWVAPENGYLLCWFRNGIDSSARKTEAFDVTVTSSVVEARAEKMETEIGFRSVPVTLSETLNGWMDSNGKINAYATQYLDVYQVVGGNEYTISGSYDCSAGEGYCGACFFENEPEVGDTADVILQGGSGIAWDGAYSVTYTPPTNGYIVCYRRRSSNTSSVADTLAYPYVDLLESLLNNDLIGQMFPLSGKTVAVLGDSIMQNMCTPEVPTNTTTFQDITGTDPTQYTVDDITIISGYIYLTSTLVDGNVGENTVRLRPVNSGQADIDSKRWPELSTKLNAGDLFVLAYGGGRIVEATDKIITDYPARHTSGPLDGLMEDLPNQVRQLLRVVSEGTHNAPDCVLIWMGVNGADTVITDTFEEAFSIDWSVLSDDQAGYVYRSKFYGAMRFAIESIYRAFPYATIIIASPVQNSRGDKKIDESGYAYRGYHSLNNVSEAMKLIAGRYACIFVDALHEIGLANFAYKADSYVGSNQVATGTALGNLVPTFLADISVDGLHPNANGKVLWTNYIANQLKTRYFPKK